MINVNKAMVAVTGGYDGGIPAKEGITEAIVE